jgi:hypothetical protein
LTPDSLAGNVPETGELVVGYFGFSQLFRAHPAIAMLAANCPSTDAKRAVSAALVVIK